MNQGQALLVTVSFLSCSYWPCCTTVFQDLKEKKRGGGGREKEGVGEEQEEKKEEREGSKEKLYFFSGFNVPSSKR